MWFSARFCVGLVGGVGGEAHGLPCATDASAWKRLVAPHPGPAIGVSGHKTRRRRSGNLLLTHPWGVSTLLAWLAPSGHFPPPKKPGFWGRNAHTACRHVHRLLRQRPQPELAA